MPESGDEDGGGASSADGIPSRTPLGLEYFGPPKEERRLLQSAELGAGLVVVGWVPFACGIVNVMVANNTYSAAVAGSHKGGAVLFLAAGIGASAVGLWRLAVLKHTAGLLLAVVVVLVQLLIASCLVTAYVTGP
jgi:hypothetical protein